MLTHAQPVAEAPLSDTGSGIESAGPGWFVMNMSDAAGWTHPTFGSGVVLTSGADRASEHAVNVQVLAPGQANCQYHHESNPEEFLILSGTCLVIIEEQERTLVAGDFVHCPPMTRHVFVGAGDGPCAILMIGAKTAPGECGYPYSEVAARHGASAPEATTDSKMAYGECGPMQDTRVDLSWIFGSSAS